MTAQIYCFHGRPLTEPCDDCEAMLAKEDRDGQYPPLRYVLMDVPDRAPAWWWERYRRAVARREED